MEKAAVKEVKASARRRLSTLSGSELVAWRVCDARQCCLHVSPTERTGRAAGEGERPPGLRSDIRRGSNRFPACLAGAAIGLWGSSIVHAVGSLRRFSDGAEGTATPGWCEGRPNSARTAARVPLGVWAPGRLQGEGSWARRQLALEEPVLAVAETRPSSVGVSFVRSLFRAVSRVKLDLAAAFGVFSADEETRAGSSVSVSRGVRLCR